MLGLGKAFIIAGGWAWRELGMKTHSWEFIAVTGRVRLIASSVPTSF